MAVAIGVLATKVPALGIIILFLMFVQSALFGPAKYGILPEILPHDRVGWGTGVLQAFTFVSILAGTIVGPWLYGEVRASLWLAGVVLVGLAAVGYVFSLMMTPTPAANPAEVFHVNPVRMMGPYVRAILTHRGLRWTILCNAVFWGVAIMFQSGATQLLKLALGLEDANVGIAFVPIVIGNGLGCFLASVLSRRGILLSSVPWFAALMVVGSAILVAYVPGVDVLETMDEESRRALAWIASPVMGMVGLCAGALVVPLQSYIVSASDAALRSGIWAANNLFVAFGWVVGGVLYAPLATVRNNPADVFLAGSLMVLGVILLAAFKFAPLRPLSARV
jgi:acyl-[acyl-carrier-protein]-phospholipid O-acyltransferase/long-chain-fatty-acid--[acyl-carrier-protein] ligase